MDESEDPEAWERFWKAWEAVQIRRNVEYGLFTFGQSDLPYLLVLVPDERAEGEDRLVSVYEGLVKVDRAKILSPYNLPPQLHEFFESSRDASMAQHILSRSAHFRHLRLNNRRKKQETTSDNVDEVVDRLNRRLDADGEDRTAILTAPAAFAGLAVLRYAAERIIRSTPENLQELREKGFLP